MPCSLPPTIRRRTQLTPADGRQARQALAVLVHAGRPQPQPLEVRQHAVDRAVALVDVELRLRDAGEPDGGRHDGGDDVGAGLEPALEAGDAVHVERGRDEPVRHGEAHRGDGEQLVGVAGGAHVGERRARPAARRS